MDDFINLPDSILWQRALGYYAACDWFMVHEALEELWKRTHGEKAEFYQALLQAAVSLYHWGNGNFSGGRQLAKSAVERMAALPETMQGIDLKGYRQAYTAAVAPLLAGGPVKPLDPSMAPPLQE